MNMMPKELPNVMNDKWYQKDARDFAKNMMGCNGILHPCKDFKIEIYEQPKRKL